MPPRIFIQRGISIGQDPQFDSKMHLCCKCQPSALPCGHLPENLLSVPSFIDPRCLPHLTRPSSGGGGWRHSLLAQQALPPSLVSLADSSSLRRVGWCFRTKGRETWDGRRHPPGFQALVAQNPRDLALRVLPPTCPPQRVSISSADWVGWPL